MSKPDKYLFDSLYEQYHPMVLQMSRGYMKGDIEVAKDLSQEVFINVWNALPKFKGDSGYKTWIYRITVNTCLKYIRDKKDKTTLEADKVVSEEAADSSQKADADPKQDEFAPLYKAIGQLAEVDRLIIMMVLDESEYEEIADVIGISAVNVRVKIHRIKKNLKKHLEDER